MSGIRNTCVINLFAPVFNLFEAGIANAYNQMTKIISIYEK